MFTSEAVNKLMKTDFFQWRQTGVNNWRGLVVNSADVVKHPSRQSVPFIRISSLGTVTNSLWYWELYLLTVCEGSRRDRVNHTESTVRVSVTKCSVTGRIIIIKTGLTLGPVSFSLSLLAWYHDLRPVSISLSLLAWHQVCGYQSLIKQSLYFSISMS